MAQDPQDQVLRPSSQGAFSAQRRCVCRRGTKSWYQEQRQKVDEEEEWEGNKGEGEEGFVLEDKGLPLGREDTVVAHR